MYIAGASLLLISLAIGCHGKYGPEDLIRFKSAGLGNIRSETINGPTILEAGSIPTWLQGNFLRHSCGVFGETEHRDKALPNYITHMFDCLEIGQKFKINNGTVTFTNKWYDTVVNDIYNWYGRNMNKSSVFQPGTFGLSNAQQVDTWDPNITRSSKVVQVPHVSWWQVGDIPLAMSEGPLGVAIDTETMQQKGWIQYADDNFPMTQEYMYTNNPAHEHTEADGTLWSTVVVIRWLSASAMQLKRVVYKVGADKYRHVVGEFLYGVADLKQCHGMARFPDLDIRPGYMHSFAITENYIILPETAYFLDPCVYSHYDNHKPFFPQGFSFEKHGFSRILVMRKSDGQFFLQTRTIPLFVTHQLGAYEAGDSVHMDMLTYDDAGAYETMPVVDNMLGPDPYTTNVSRISLNMTSKSVSVVDLRRGKSPATFEMSNINYAYNGKKYTYAYMVRNFDLHEQNAITKLNVDTGVELEYLLPEGSYVQEPQFIPYPGAIFEDDGVILSQGFDGIERKAIMVVIDAKTMTLIGRVVAPDMALFGLHNRLFPLRAGSAPNFQMPAIPVIG
ncbi:carotenoid isomerooxygenase-like isoform X2 [Dreissena polymorpha]|uniref:Uncharacterized protein n=2 Tax=Dreissena polymorpha TaxID=45954 RepID=A0A9D4MEN4_DREPO|nr:carotenoid isomerooxygenase-like isoform X2 [Dreissena polymorpha]KAH3873821.1 hypothetical protein DPMN_037061 [Dreissena polymorpha]